jgi:hypothetical protein
MSIILNNTDVVYQNNTRYWAERGLIHWEDKSTGESGSESVRTMLQRLQALNNMVGNVRTGKGYHRPDEVTDHQRFVDSMLILIEKARNQGMPDDPAAAKSLASTRKKTMITVGNHTKF